MNQTNQSLMTMNPDIIAWLESPEGEAWSKRFHANNDGWLYALVTVKDETNLMSNTDVLWLANA